MVKMIKRRGAGFRNGSAEPSGRASGRGLAEAFDNFRLRVFLGRVRSAALAH
ncbi:MAG: hypothetical protein ACE5MB_06855 [Anaerolineae bacterium]